MSRPGPLRAARRTITWAGRLAPATTAALAERAFLTPRSPAPRPWEAAVLAEAAERRVATVGGHLPIYEWGDPCGPTVLLAHGWNGHAGQLAPWVGPLVERGRRVVAVDLPGHGAGAKRLTHVPEMGAAFGQVARSLGRVHAVVAHSVGAMVTALAVAGGLRPQRLLFVAASVRGRRWLEDFAAFVGLPQVVRARVGERVRRRCGHALEDLTIEATAPDLPPALFLHSNDDPVAPRAEAQWAARVSGSDFATFDELGHHRILRAPSTIATGLAFVAPSRSASHPAPSRERSTP